MKKILFFMMFISLSCNQFSSDCQNYNKKLQIENLKIKKKCNFLKTRLRIKKLQLNNFLDKSKNFSFSKKKYTWKTFIDECSKKDSFVGAADFCEKQFSKLKSFLLNKRFYVFNFSNYLNSKGVSQRGGKEFILFVDFENGQTFLYKKHFR